MKSKLKGEEGSCEITDISNIDGEASINNRKGKLIYFYKPAKHTKPSTPLTLPTEKAFNKQNQEAQAKVNDYERHLPYLTRRVVQGFPKPRDVKGIYTPCCFYGWVLGWKIQTTGRTCLWAVCRTGHAATVTLNFVNQGSETELILEARGVPSNEEERMKEGWQRYYFNAIKQTFGYGARLC
ncbi:hypothetical protein cypCar_00014562 [Cyprinus carpio]|nr:hypothetical protein cypCar_00014562 [Cyprinus carpio]